MLRQCYVIYFVQKTELLIAEKVSITQELLVVESCPTSHLIALLMLYRLIYNIRSHFNELILT